jgi:hypothetical protein
MMILTEVFPLHKQAIALSILGRKINRKSNGDTKGSWGHFDFKLRLLSD